MNKLRRWTKGIGYRIAQAAEWGLPADRVDLLGDRDVEWGWIAAKMPETPGRVLDFGPATSYLGLIAAYKGGDVMGLDLTPVWVPFGLDNLRCVKGDIVGYDFGEQRFDTIINCSSVEHVGLGARYGGADDEDGDLVAMQVLRNLLSGPQASMVLTIPVGVDGVFSPYHRIYGEQRLPKLLEGFAEVESRYMAKTPGDNRWLEVSRDRALSVQGSESFYGLGLFVLRSA